MTARSITSLMLMLALAACNSDLVGAGAARVDGSLIVMRSEGLPGALPRRVTIDPESGATQNQVNWLPNEREAFAGAPFASDIALSRDGRWVTWVEFRRDTIRRYQDSEGNWRSDQHSRQLYVAKVGSSTRSMITPEFHSDYAPSFSPDGQRLVVLREFFNGENQMITMARDGSDVQPVLIRRRQPRGGPDWSPTGARIAYFRPDRGAVVVVGTDGSDPTEVLKNGYAGQPAWSPSGDRFAVRAFIDGAQQLAIVRSTGALVTSLPFQGELASSRLAWSPDGTRIAFCTTSAATGRSTIVTVVTVSTGEARVLTPTGYSDCSPIWRP